MPLRNPREVFDFVQETQSYNGVRVKNCRTPSNTFHLRLDSLFYGTSHGSYLENIRVGSSLIPKILYHGTTRGRYEAGVRFKGLLSNMPRSKLFPEDWKAFGSVYLTDGIQNAAMWGLAQITIDLTDEYWSKVNRTCDNLGVVLAIRTSNLKVELDPERPPLDQWRHDLFLKGVKFDESSFLNLMGSAWFRVRGDIPRKYIIPYKDVPFELQDDVVKDIVIGGTIRGALKERGVI